jgi:hypothetical protein
MNSLRILAFILVLASAGTAFAVTPYDPSTITQTQYVSSTGSDIITNMRNWWNYSTNTALRTAYPDIDIYVLLMERSLLTKQETWENNAMQAYLENPTSQNLATYNKIESNETYIESDHTKLLNLEIKEGDTIPASAY